MTIRNLTAFLLIAGLVAAPLADAAPKGKGTVKTTGKAKPRSKKNAKSTPKKTNTKPASKAEVTKPAETNPATSQTGDASFDEFMKRLDEQVKANTFDSCPAMEYVLSVTGDDDLAAVAWMKRAADAGNAAARHYIANRTLAFIPLDQMDSPKVKDAMALLKKSADQGFVPALLDLAVCRKAGRIAEKDENAANALLLEACKNGNMEARFKWLLLTDRLTRFSDLERPEVKSEVERGNHYITYYMSAQAPDSPVQFEMLKDAASKGNSDALFTLSSLLHESDTPRSFELLQESAKLHNDRAIFVLGSFLLEPDSGKLRELNLTKDTGNGIHLVKLASMLGNVQADIALGNTYYGGLYGTEKNMKAAYEHFRQAYEVHGNVAAAASMGLMLLRGQGVEQDTARGLDLLMQASRAGYAYASVLLAYAAYEGLGCEADAGKAIDYLQDAAGLRLPVAYVFMAYVTAKGGHKLAASEKDARSYLDMAALDMGDQAQKLYDELMQAGKWEPHP